MAAATAAVFGLWAANTMALSLGRITVQSSIGEPLRAEIEIPDINAEEASTLKAAVASPDAFRAAGLEYNAAMSSLQVSMQRRPDGRAFIRISSDRTINEPFVDMILEASWASGRIVRDYTMLFDPPNLRAASPAAPTPAQVSGAPAAAAATSQPMLAAKPVEGRKPSGRAAAATPTRAAGESDRQVTVKAGDTAGKIAAATKPANVSLDQMLVALLRANPDAFIGANINRIKAGAVMDVPSAEQAGATSQGEARQMIVAQSKDFNDFRRKLAGEAPTAKVTAADRKATGTVQAKVEDKKPTTTAPDKLTLSKGAVQGKPTEAQIAKERAAKEAASRTAELSKNIAELGKIGATSRPAAPAAAAAPASAAKAPVAPTVPVVAAVPAASTAAPAPTVAKPVAPASAAPVATVPAPSPAAVAASAPPTPAATASAPTPAASATAPTPAAAAPVKRQVAPPAPAPEPDLVDGLLENPLVPAGAVGLIALLAGFGFYRMRQRKKASQVDSAFLESRLQPDSFFGTSGGQRVDTNDSAATGSSMVYSPSQLDAADDVDPVAEADVYLAYGRDLQAEEILKEALRTNSSRIAIHQKLLEIYAKRRDTKGFEGVAGQAYKLTGGDGADWARICELGLSIDPTNALYQPGGQPSGDDSGTSRPAPLEPVRSASDDTMPLSAAPSPSMDLDLDLDFSLDDEPSAISPASSSKAMDPTISMRATGMATAPLHMAADADATAKLPSSANFSLPDLDVPGSDLTLSNADAEDFKAQAATSFGMTTPVPLPASELRQTAAAAPADAGMLEFDLESLSLDLGGDTEQPIIAEPPATSEDPLATKLALAEEFSAIGDADGARALIEEVIEEASGEMKTKAQRALSNL